jgi:hypothetical protein
MTGISLDRSPLYGTTSCARLAHDDVLGFSPDQLMALTRDHNAYRAFTRITGGKKRAVTQPLGDLQKVHDRLFDLLDRIEKPDYLHSGVRSRSHVTNACVHRGHKPMVKIDIRRFFPSIDVPRVNRFFSRQMACAAPVAELLTRLCTFRGHVPIGSRMSQHLAYFAASPMLEDLHRLSLRQGVQFTCYVDDLSFSGTGATPSFLWRVKRVVHHHRFSHHNDRCYQADDRKTITGVTLTGDTVSVPSRHIGQMRRDERALDRLCVADRLKAINRLIGSMAAASDIEPGRRKDLKQLVARRAQLTPEPKERPTVVASDAPDR